MKATRLLSLIAIALLAGLLAISCNKKKDKVNDPLRSTTWTALDGDNLMILKFELGTLSTFYIGDNNLNRKSNVSSSAYTLTDDTKVTFADLNGSYNNEKYRFKTGILDGDAMTVSYDRWTTAAGMDGPKEHIQAVFKKHTAK